MEIIDFLIEEVFISLTLVVLIALLIGNVIADVYKKYTDIDVNRAINLMDEALVILDVREDKERKSGHIKNDQHLPMAKVKTSLNDLDKNKAILVYCRSGSRGAHTCSILTRAGFLTVYNLKGGFMAWQKANLPISK